MNKYMLVLNPQSRVITEAELPTINGKTLFEVHEQLLHCPANITRDEQRWYATEAYNIYGEQVVAGFLMPSKELRNMSINALTSKLNSLVTDSEEFNYILFVLSARCNEYVNVELTFEQALIDMYGNRTNQRVILLEYIERLELKAQLKALLK